MVILAGIACYAIMANAFESVVDTSYAVASEMHSSLRQSGTLLSYHFCFALAERENRNIIEKYHAAAG
jgi:hypothetical protein